jgi:putative redox protein
MPTTESKYLGDLRTEVVHVQSGTTLITDAPLDNHGRGEAFSPSDLVAAALGSCIITIIGIVARRDEIDLSGTRWTVTKVMSPDLPRRIIKIGLDLTIVTQSELSTSEKEKLKLAAQTCPVALSLHPHIEQDLTFSWQTA